MDRTSLEEINKGKKNFLLVVMLIAVVIGVSIGLFTTDKSEKLICSKSKNICSVEKTNYFNIKKRENIIEFSEILYPTYIPKNVAGNMYARGYSAYYLAFMAKNKKPVQIFSIEFYEKEELNEVINQLKLLLKSPEDEFILEQKL
jgi:hypothetical protein